MQAISDHTAIQIVDALTKAGVTAENMAGTLNSVLTIARLDNRTLTTDGCVRVANYVAAIVMFTECDPRLVPQIFMRTTTLIEQLTPQG
jgi:predicted glycosyltransferase